MTMDTPVVQKTGEYRQAAEVCAATDNPVVADEAAGTMLEKAEELIVTPAQNIVDALLKIAVGEREARDTWGASTAWELVKVGLDEARRFLGFEEACVMC